MEFERYPVFFDNEDAINFFNYLLKKNLPFDSITLLPCTKMKNRIYIQVILNEYKIIICPVKTTYHWFSVTKQDVQEKELTGVDVHEFSTIPEDFDKLFNFILDDQKIIFVSKYIEKIKNHMSDIKKKIEQ